MRAKRIDLFRIMLAVVAFIVPMSVHAGGIAAKYRGLIGGTTKVTLYLETTTSRADTNGRNLRRAEYSGYYILDSVGERMPVSGSSVFDPRYSSAYSGIGLRQPGRTGYNDYILWGSVSPEGVFAGNWGHPDSSPRYGVILYQYEESENVALASAQREFREMERFWKEWQATLKAKRANIVDMVVFPLDGSAALKYFWAAVREGERQTMYEPVVINADFADFTREESLKPYGYRHLFSGEVREKMEKMEAAQLGCSISGMPGDDDEPRTPSYYILIRYEDMYDNVAPISVRFYFSRVDGSFKLTSIHQVD